MVGRVGGVEDYRCVGGYCEGAGQMHCLVGDQVDEIFSGAVFGNLYFERPVFGAVH